MLQHGWLHCWHSVSLSSPIWQSDSISVFLNKPENTHPACSKLVLSSMPFLSPGQVPDSPSFRIRKQGSELICPHLVSASLRGPSLLGWLPHKPPTLSSSTPRGYQCQGRKGEGHMYFWRCGGRRAALSRERSVVRREGNGFLATCSRCGLWKPDWMASICWEGLSDVPNEQEKPVLSTCLVTFSLESLHFTKMLAIKPSLSQGYVGLSRQQWRSLWGHLFWNHCPSHSHSPAPFGCCFS